MTDTKTEDDPFQIFLGDDSGRLEIAKQLWQRFCEDLMQDDDGKAKTRLIAGIQVALRDAYEQRKTEPLFYYKAED